MTLATALQQAIADHQAGRLPAAERLYRAILAASPQQPDAMRNLALLHGHVAQQRHALCTQALDLHNDGRHAEAEQQARWLAGALPDEAVIWKILAAALKAQGKDALPVLQQAAALVPGDAEIHCDIAVTLGQRGQTAAAVAHFRRALAIDPENADTHYNLGNALKDLNHPARRDEALACYRRALALNPDFFEAHGNLAALLHQLGHFAEAVASCRLALALVTDGTHGHADHTLSATHYNLANALNALGQTEQAIASYHDALARQPAFVEAWCNLGLALRDQGRLGAALDCYRRALAIDPGHAEARNNFATALLQNGEFEAGWQHWQIRTCATLQRPAATLPTLPFARWQGQTLHGKSLLIWREQGLGDELQFCRYAPMLKRLGAARITLACHPALTELLATLDGVDALHPLEQSGIAPETHAYWTLMLDLPHHLATRLDNIPAQTPYLRADPDRMRQVAAQLAAHRLPARTLKIGVCWRGSPGYAADPQRSFGLAPLPPLFALADCAFFSLLPDSRAEFLAATAAAATINGDGDGDGGVDLGHEIDAAGPPFQETAALIMQLDLVISCDTVIGHLAGALGKPVWLLLPFVADWRWLTQREDSPWYPRTVLFRQRQAGDWGEVVQRVRQRLEHLILAHRQCAHPTIPHTPTASPTIQ